MKIEIKVPAMGESISEATVGELLKKSGSVVKLDDEIVEIETDKVNQVLYASQGGVLKFLVQTGDVVKIGQVIAEIDAEGVVVKETEEKKVIEVPPMEEQGGRIMVEDFIQEVKEPVREVKSVKRAGEETRRPMSKIRQVIARRLVEAKQTTAMLTTFNEVDMSSVMRLREEYQELFQKTYQVKLGFMGFFVKACAEALKVVPGLNSYIEGNEIVERHYVDMGVAVGTDRGVVVPVVRRANELTLPEIEQAIAGFAKKAREGGLSVDDLQGGSFTITNGGVFGSLLSTPILNPPQSGILGMHKIEKRAVVIEDEIMIRPMMYVALSYDHRIVDGKEAVTFLVHVKNVLEDPARLLVGV